MDFKHALLIKRTRRAYLKQNEIKNSQTCEFFMCPYTYLYQKYLGFGNRLNTVEIETITK